MDRAPNEIASPAPVAAPTGMTVAALAAAAASVPAGAPAAAVTGSDSDKSLFGKILDWALIPLLILWPINMGLEQYVSVSLANSAYDRELRSKAAIIGDSLKMEHGRLVARFDDATVRLLRGSNGSGQFAVRGFADELLAGDAELKSIEFTADMTPGEVYLRVHEPSESRTAYVFVPMPGSTGTVQDQVAETEEARQRLANEIVGRVITAQFIIVPLAVLLVWFGLTKGLRPVEDVRARIAQRRSNDLSPLDARGAPLELHPFITSINDLMTRLDASIRAQRRFVADAAHQIRTPLAGLKTQAELAMREGTRAELQHTLQQIATSADRASHVVNQLLALARAETTAAVATKRLDLDLLARDVTSDWVPAAIERGIDLGFESANGDHAAIDGNAALLRELISNLIDNALRYTPRRGRVTVRVSLDKRVQQVVLAIEDTGIGIAPSDRDMVFERFYRAPNAEEWTRAGPSGASGLGLAIVRSIASQHHAEITLSDNVGAATVITGNAADARQDPMTGTIVQLAFEAAG